MQTYLALAHLDSEAGYLLTQLASAGTTGAPLFRMS